MSAGRRHTTRPRFRPTLVLAASLAAALVACGAPGPPAGTRLSLLAVGDWGVEPERADDLATLVDVAGAMAASHAARPADALVLLGDNFYPDGLQADELVSRLRADLSGPFCVFLDDRGPRWSELADACVLGEGRRRQPIPIHVVLGNHDLHAPESPDLQRDAVPEFVANWQLAPGPTSVVELGDGVSLVGFDSTNVFAGRASAEQDLTALTRALRSARGPWRVLFAHHPVAGASQGDDAEAYERYRGLVLGALAAAGVPVQLALAGHEHNLQILQMDAPGPRVQVVSGAAANPRGIHDENPRRRVGVSHTPGFARVDWVGTGADERLVVSLYTRPRWPWRVLGATRLAARWAVERNGDAGPW